ncbi:MAG: hypothetical protein HY834_09095 [Devosia nanyangense]|uniref:Uncharacterized protein n=1 Tax=Devosia nanyangense TaxID=1228055 RepID=A0A933NYW2_9HYPH|nr:hypothetical protein [Devosia nanyangense]
MASREQATPVIDFCVDGNHGGRKLLDRAPTIRAEGSSQFMPAQDEAEFPRDYAAGVVSTITRQQMTDQARPNRHHFVTRSVAAKWTEAPEDQ